MESCKYLYKKPKTTPPSLTWSNLVIQVCYGLFEVNGNPVDPFYLQLCGIGSPTK